MSVYKISCCLARQYCCFESVKNNLQHNLLTSITVTGGNLQQGCVQLPPVRVFSFQNLPSNSINHVISKIISCGIFFLSYLEPVVRI